MTIRSAIAAAATLSVVSSIVIQWADWNTWYLSGIPLLAVLQLVNFNVNRGKAGATLAGGLFAGLVIRFLTGLVLIVLAKFMPHIELRTFAIHFICHYVIFTIFEILLFSQLLKQKQPTQP